MNVEARLPLRDVGRSAPRTLTALVALLLCAGVLAGQGPAQPEPAPADEAAKAEEAAALLAELFDSDSHTTNTLGMLMVRVPTGLRVARFEVTQADYQSVVGSNPSEYRGAQLPVQNVTVADATAFCQRLTRLEHDGGKLPKNYAYRLPTEQEWESYVAEAPLDTAITSYLGDRSGPMNVGALPPNKLGLYDVRGNVWEWCGNNVARGASFRSHEDFVWIPFRFAGSPGERYDDIGFRYVLVKTGETGQ